MIRLRVHPRSVVVGAVLAAAALVLLVLSLGTGELSIPPGDVISALLGGGDPATQFVVETLRLPRALTAVLVGLALGASGAIFQSLTRNPLGSPDIIGLLQGASAAAVLQIVILAGTAYAVAGAALAGGLTTALIVYLLAFRHGGVQGYTLVLVGIGVNAILAGVTEYLLTQATITEATDAQRWLTGSLNGRGWEHVQPVGAALLVLFPLTALLSRPLVLLELGDDAARGLGVGVERSRGALIFVGVALCSVATASTGPIAFVALAAPQLARRLTHASGPGVACAALMGAVLLLASDYAAQRLFGSVELPVGVVTGVAGGLYLIWLLAREGRRRAA